MRKKLSYLFIFFTDHYDRMRQCFHSLKNNFVRE